MDPSSASPGRGVTRDAAQELAFRTDWLVTKKRAKDPCRRQGMNLEAADSKLNNLNFYERVKRKAQHSLRKNKCG
eukprot:6182928-Pleurochrysis_carterae.AAC.2